MCIRDSSGAGVDLQAQATLVTLKSNILAGNGLGISGDPGSVLDGALNNFFDNTSDYLGVSASPGDFVADPLLVDPGLLNFHLQLASPCRDAGVSAPEFNDKDGSRNDIGADGGPGGAQDLLAPLAAMIVSPAQGPAPLDVTLDGTGSSDEWGIAHYSWDLDISDGIQEDVAGAVASATYPAVSSYTLTLTVTDNSGMTAQTTQQIDVGNGLPTGSGLATPHAGTAPLNVQLSGQGDDPDGGPLTWSWDFDGDGLEDSSLQNPTYDYISGTAPGAYRSVLTVTDDEGAAASDVVPVTITEETVLASTLAFPGTAGTVEVTDPSSPLFGMIVEFPANACSEKTVLTINGVASPASAPLQYVNAMAQVGPAGMVFSQPVTITMPLPPGTNTSQDLEALVYDAASGTWKRTGITNLGVVAGSPAMFRFTATRGASYAIAGEILPSAQFTQSQVSVSENGGSVTVVLQLDESVQPGNPATVGFATANDTARVGQDFEFASGSLVYAAGETQKTVTVPLVNDATDEPQETFRIVITTVEGGTTGATSIVTVSIADDDAPDTPQTTPPDNTPPTDPPGDGVSNVPSGCAGIELPSGKMGPPPPEMLAAVCLLLMFALQRGMGTRQRVPVRARG